MKFQTPLIPATLLQRYKRFLADVRLTDGTVVAAHCANPGAITGLSHKGANVLVERNDGPERKLCYSWKLAELEWGHSACVDTAMSNKMLKRCYLKGPLPGPVF